MTPRSSTLISVRGLTRRFRVGSEWVAALAGVSFDLCRGEYAAIVGPSGSGKSTLLQLLGALDSPTSGSYRFEGREVARMSDAELGRLRNEKIGFVFQSFHLLPRTSALSNVLLPFSYRSGVVREHQALAEQALALTRIAHRRHHFPEQLSGGERQRIAIARAIVTRPALLLCDEPTGNLDRKTSSEITELFEELRERLGMTLVVVTHDQELARRARRMLSVSDGALAYDGDPVGVAS